MNVGTVATAQRPSNVKRLIPNTSSERLASLMESLSHLEGVKRQSITSDERLVRMSLNCFGSRCNSAAASRRNLPFAPISSVEELQNVVSVSSSVRAQQQQPNLHTLSADAAPDAANQGVPNRAHQMRRELAAARRKLKKEVVACTAAAPADCDEQQAAAPIVGRHNLAMMEEKKLTLRCLMIEFAALPRKYESLWIETLMAHAFMLAEQASRKRAERRQIGVVQIQSTFRMFSQRTKYHFIRQQIVLLQAAGRAFTQRRGFPQFGRCVMAGRFLHNVWAAYCDRVMLAKRNYPKVLASKQRRGATRIQSLVRGVLQRKKFWVFRRRDRAAKVIQRVTRGLLERRRQERLHSQFVQSVAALQADGALINFRIAEMSRRRQIEFWENESRLFVQHIALLQTTAAARMAIAKRRILEPHIDASSAFETVGSMLSTSSVRKANDYYTPNFSSIFSPSKVAVSPTRSRAASANTSRHGSSMDHSRHGESLHASRNKSRSNVVFMQLEAEEGWDRSELLRLQFQEQMFLLDQHMSAVSRMLTFAVL